MAVPNRHPMIRDEAFWRSRMTCGFDHVSAPAEFAKHCDNGSLIACNPRGPHNKPIRVAFELPTDCDHYLFKADGDTHGRAYAMRGRPEDFQQDRSDRMGWLRAVLHEPDAIYADRSETGTFLYVSRTLPSEEFAVVIHEVHGRRGYYFVSGYVLTEPQWSQKKRTRLTKAYPRKSQAGNKKKGID